MKVGVSLKIDVSKIDKSMLFKGQKGVYLDAKVFIDIDQKDQYDNNGMITQEVSKDAPQGTQGAILGNCKVFWNDSGQQQPQYSQGQQQKPRQQAPQQNNQQQYAQQGRDAQGFKPAQQQAPKVNPQEPSIDFDDDLPF